MAFFDWGPDMSVDADGPIDADHRQLVDLLNRLHDYTSQGRGQEVVSELLGELLRYTEEHLRREEALMASAGYAQLEQHKKGHDRFVAQLQGLKTRYDAGSISVASQLSTVLRDWLSLHIRRSDRELRGRLKPH